MNRQIRIIKALLQLLMFVGGLILLLWANWIVGLGVILVIGSYESARRMEEYE